MRTHELHVLAAEQAALRRVATLVARGTPPEEVFAAVTQEVERVLPVDLAIMARYESGGALTVLAASGTPVAPGSRWTLGGNNVSTRVFETGLPARIDGYLDSSSGAVGIAGRELVARSSVATPVTVEGRRWGLMIVGSVLESPLPSDTRFARTGSAGRAAVAPPACAVWRIASRHWADAWCWRVPPVRARAYARTCPSPTRARRARGRRPG